MFVQTNTIQAVKSYFKERLQDLFSESEIRFMMREAVLQRMKISASDYLVSDSLLLSESDLLYFRSIVKRLQANEPFQYIIGSAEFFGLIIKTDSRALIPRPETEELVEWVLNSFPNSSINLLDLCTGSGCIAVALKSNRSQWNVAGSDLSSGAIDLANENIEALGLDVHIYQFDATRADSYECLEKNFFHCWVSNPPYIPANERIQMDKNVTEFEPDMALFVPVSDTLLFYRKIAEQGKEYLVDRGNLFFEIHENFGTQTKELLEFLGYVNVEIKKDLQGKDRMVRAVLGVR